MVPSGRHIHVAVGGRRDPARIRRASIPSPVAEAVNGTLVRGEPGSLVGTLIVHASEELDVCHVASLSRLARR
jgi:hypothetical protein